MNKKRKSYILSCEISQLQEVELGGCRQKIAIEGKEKTLPILICLHGGPGMPIPFGVGSRGLFPNITDRFIMVYWDQLGCGINNCKLDNSFTIERFAEMTVDLIKEIRLRFPENKLCLFGMSWGSILTLHSAIRVPEMLDCVAVYGQIVTPPLLSDSAFDAVEQSSAPSKKKSLARAFRAKRPDLTLKEMRFLSGVIRKYTDGYVNHNSKSAPVGNIIKGLLSGPDYTFKDFIAVFKNGYSQNDNLTHEMASMDLSGAFNDIAVPYHIFQGETDVVSATNDVIKSADGLNNKNVTCTVLPHAGHFPTETAITEIFEKIYQSAFSC